MHDLFRTPALTAWIAAAAMIVAFAGSVRGSTQLVALLATHPVDDIYFDADARRVYRNATDRTSNHMRTKLHPLVSISSWSAVRVMAALGMSDADAVRTMVAINAAVTAGVLVWVLGTLGLAPVDQSLMFLVAASSATAWFWFTVAETFPFGAPGILLAVGLVARSHQAAQSALGYFLVNAATLGVTISNWVIGLVATFVARPVREAWRLSALAFGVLLAIWAAQLVIFPLQRFPTRQEMRFLRPFTATAFAQVPRVFFVTSVVVPAIHEEPDTTSPAIRLSTVRSGIGSTGLGGTIASAAWVGMLVAGVVGLVGLRRLWRVQWLLGIAVASQLGLHLFYGRETFLYSAHYVPLLLVVAACGLLTRAAPVVRAMAAVLIVLAVPANVSQMAYVIDYLQKGLGLPQ